MTTLSTGLTLDSRSTSPLKEKQLKVVVVGDGASGKTSLITRYVQDQFGKEYDQTVGLDFFRKHLTFEGDQSITLQIWDIGGQTLGGSMLDKYIYGAGAVLFVYDISNIRSFDNIQDWLSAISAMVDTEECYFALVGNKVDLEHLRVIPRQEHDSFAKENHMGSFMVSAKTGESVNIMFKVVAARKLRIKLSRSDIEGIFTVVKANVNQHPELTAPSTSSAPSRRRISSVICSIQ